MFVGTLKISIQVSLNIFCDVYAHNKLINLVYFSFSSEMILKQIANFQPTFTKYFIWPQIHNFILCTKNQIRSASLLEGFFHKWQQTSGKYKCLKVKHIPRENSVSQCLDTYFTLAKYYNLLDRWSEFKCFKLSKTFHNLILSLHIQQAT